jgi:hypothetical protein
MNDALTRALAAVLFFGILTCWSPEYWPVAALQAGAFLLAGIWLAHAAVRHRHLHVGIGLFPLTGLVACGALQLAVNGTEYRLETVKSILYWAANAAVFLVTLETCGDTHTRNRFLRAVLWFGFAVSLVTILQYFTSEGKIFWLFATSQSRVLGPFLYKNQCAAFIELVFPLAVYQSIIERRHSLIYMAMAASMFAAVMAATSRVGVVLVAGELVAILTLAGMRGLVPAVNGRAAGGAERGPGSGCGLAGDSAKIPGFGTLSCAARAVDFVFDHDCRASVAGIRAGHLACGVPSLCTLR